MAKTPDDFDFDFDSLKAALESNTSAIESLPPEIAKAIESSSEKESGIEDLKNLMKGLLKVDEDTLKQQQDLVGQLNNLTNVLAQSYIKLAQKQEESKEEVVGAFNNIGQSVSAALGDAGKSFVDAIEGVNTPSNLTGVSTPMQAFTTAMSPPSPPSQPPPGDGNFGRGRFEFEDNDFFQRQSNQLNSYLSQLTGGVTLTQLLFTGAAADAFIFSAAINDIAFETQGITGATRDLQYAFMDYGKVVQETGKNVTEFQNNYLKNLKKGTSANKTGIKVLKAALATSTFIGSNTEATADLFGDWNRTLGLSGRQMQQLARDSLSIARSTGVTGDELVNAMNASKKILENLRNQGNLTSVAMKNVIAMSAEAQKVGVGDAYSKIANSLSGTNQLLDSLGDNTGRYVLSLGANIGKSGEMMAGTFMQSRDNLASLASGMEGTLQRLTGGAVKSFADLEKLGPEARKNLSIQLKSLTGMEITEFQRVGETFRKQSLGLAGNLSDLEKEMKKVNLSEQERIKLQTDYANALSEAGLATSTAFSEAIKDAENSDFGSIAKDFMAGMDTSDFKKDLSAAVSGLSKQGIGIEIDGQTITSDMIQALDPVKDAAKLMEIQQMSAAASLKNAAAANDIDLTKMGLDPNFEKQLSQAIADGDALRIREINDEMSTAAQKMGVDLKKGTSPTQELTHTLNQLNETIRNLVSGPLLMFLNLLGGLGLTLAVIGGAAAAAGLSLMGTVGTFVLGGKAISKVLKALGFRKAAASAALASRNIERGTNLFGKAGKAIDNTGSAAKGFFTPMSKGFTRARSQGQGFFKSLDRGIQGLMKSNTKSRKVLSSFVSVQDNVYKSMATVGKSVENFGTAAKTSVSKMFAPLTKGFTRATSQGSGFFAALSRGISGQTKSLQVATRASNALSSSLSSMANVGGKVVDTFKTSGATAIGSLKSSGISAASTITSKSKGMFDAFTKGFTQARSAGDGFFKSLTKGFKGGSMTLGTVQKGVRGVGTVKAGVGSARAGLAARGGIKGALGGALKGADKTLLRGLQTGLRSTQTAAKGAGGGLRALVKGVFATGKAVPGLNIALAAIDGVIGGFMGAARTAERFEKSFGEVNAGMTVSSTIAGVLVGILDGLTLGLLNFSGIGRAIEDYLAYSINNIMAIFYGFVDGFKAAFGFVGKAFDGVREQVSKIGKTLIGAFNKIFGVFGVQAESLGDIFAMMYPFFKGIGKVLGYIVGVPFAAAFWALGKAIGLLLVPFEILANLVSAAADIIAGFGKTIYGLLTLDFNLMGEGVKQIFGGVYDAIVGTFAPIVNWIGGVFSGLYDMVVQSVGPVFDWLKWAFGGIYDFLAPIVGAIGTVISTVLGAAFSTVSFIFKGIASVISTVLSPIGYVLKGIGSMFMGLVDIVSNTIGGIVDWFSWLWKTLVGGSIVPDMITGIIKWFLKLPAKIFSALMTIPSMIGNMFSNIGSYLSSFGTDTYFGTLMSQIGNVFGFIGDTISNVVGALKGVFNIFYGIATLDFGKIWEGITAIGGAIINQIKGIGKFLYTGIKNSVSYLFKVLKRVPATIFRVLKSTFVEFPKWLLGKVMDVAYLFGNFLAKIPGILYKGFVSTIKKISSFIYDAIMWPFRKIADIIVWPFKKVAELASWIYNRFWDGIDAIGGFFGNIGGYISDGLASLWDGLSGIGGMVLDGLSGLGGKILDSLSGMGGMILDGLKSAFIDFPVWLGQTMLDGLYSVFVEFPTWLYQQFENALSGVWEYIKSWIPGMESAETVAEGFSETAAQQESTRLAEGNSILHAGGAAVGGVGDVLTGDFSEGFSKIGGAAYEGAAAVGEAAWSGAKAVASALNPFNWFEEGTRQIQQPGLAMLHEGEMVLPKEVTETVAEGNGPFPKALAPKGMGLGNIFNAITDPLGAIGNAMSGIGGMITDPLGTIGNAMSGLFGFGAEEKATPESNITPETADTADTDLSEKAIPVLIANWSEMVDSMSLTHPDKMARLESDVPKTENMSNIFEGFDLKNMLDPLGIGKIASNAFDSLTNPESLFGNMQRIMDPLGIAETVKDFASPVADWFSGLFGSGEEEIASPNDSLATSAAEVSTVAEVTPAPLTDIGDRIVKERTSSQAGLGKLQSDELTRMEEASYKQVSELEQIREGINELVGLMRPTGGGSEVTGETGGGAGAGGTRNTRVPRNSPLFGVMKYGYATGGPNKQIINDGK